MLTLLVPQYSFVSVAHSVQGLGAMQYVKGTASLFDHSTLYINVL